MKHTSPYLERRSKGKRKPFGVKIIDRGPLGDCIWFRWYRTESGRDDALKNFRKMGIYSIKTAEFEAVQR